MFSLSMRNPRCHHCRTKLLLDGNVPYMILNKVHVLIIDKESKMATTAGQNCYLVGIFLIWPSIKFFALIIDQKCKMATVTTAGQKF